MGHLEAYGYRNEAHFPITINIRTSLVQFRRDWDLTTRSDAGLGKGLVGGVGVAQVTVKKLRTKTRCTRFLLYNV